LFFGIKDGVNKVVYYNNFWENLRKSFDGFYSTPQVQTNPENSNGLLYSFSSLSYFGSPKDLSSLNGARIENGKLIKVGISGNTNFDLVPELINGEWIITPYVSGTYVSPPATTITFQPINK
jgi:hypothetical protein